jgi:hypothetical protein
MLASKVDNFGRNLMNRRVLTGSLLASIALLARAQSSEAKLPSVVVYKNESCGCCKLWVQHLNKFGFPVTVHDLDNLNAVKQRVGVPFGKGSCHTAEVGGYFIEGHVPAQDISRLLRDRPKAKGLTVPGMPAGSPGMEVPSGEIQPYDVLLVAEDGSTSVFAHHGQ